jgi:Carbohydrate esterase, sialic acid-specific acetylesterase
MNKIMAQLVLLLLMGCSQHVWAKDLWVFVVGQSISANCNQQMFGPEPGVFQVDVVGAVIPAKDPLIWADCQGGSVWMPLGAKLIQAGRAEKVVFMPIGVANTKLTDWQLGGKAYEKLQRSLALIRQKGFRFDFGFWHQGSSDGGMPAADYEQQLIAILDGMERELGKGVINKWLIAQHARCYKWFDRNISTAQRAVASQRQSRRFLGPDVNALDDSFRFDSCHLNNAGQIKLAEGWFNAIELSNAQH